MYTCGFRINANLVKEDRFRINAKLVKGFGWDNVGPASQTVANHYISIRPMYRVILDVSFMTLG